MGTTHIILYTDRNSCMHAQSSRCHDVRRYNRTLGGPPGSVPQVNSQASPHEVLEPFNRYKSLRKATLQPSMDTADVKTLEKDIILRDSTTGRSGLQS